MIELEDIEISEKVEKMYKKRRKEKLKNPALCYACKKSFPTGVDLFKHLDEKPLHKTESHWITYTLGCNKCPEFKKSNCLNIPSGHFIPISKKSFLECKDIYVESVEITPYYRKEERYSITDFDQADLISKNGTIDP